MEGSRLYRGRGRSRPRRLLRRGNDGGLLDRTPAGEAGGSGSPGEHVSLLHLRPRLLLWGARILWQGRVGARAGGIGHGGLVGARVAGRVVATYSRALPAVQGAD